MYADYTCVMLHYFKLLHMMRRVQHSKAPAQNSVRLYTNRLGCLAQPYYAGYVVPGTNIRLIFMFYSIKCAKLVLKMKDNINRSSTPCPDIRSRFIVPQAVMESNIFKIAK